MEGNFERGSGFVGGGARVSCSSTPHDSSLRRKGSPVWGTTREVARACCARQSGPPRTLPLPAPLLRGPGHRPALAQPSRLPPGQVSRPGVQLEAPARLSPRASGWGWEEGPVGACTPRLGSHPETGSAPAGAACLQSRSWGLLLARGAGNGAAGGGGDPGLSRRLRWGSAPGPAPRPPPRRAPPALSASRLRGGRGCPDV